MNYTDILKFAKIDDDNVICAFEYGSRVYGNIHEKSDYDYIFIVKDRNSEQFLSDIININFYDEQSYITRLLNHEISALETLWLDSKHILKQTKKFNFVLNRSMLRKSISKKSSNSWVKSRKKELDSEFLVSKKSLWHSYRIIMFGIQISKYGEIIDYSEANYLFNNILKSERLLWDKSLFNSLSTNFKKITPKS